MNSLLIIVSISGWVLFFAMAIAACRFRQGWKNSITQQQEVIDRCGASVQRMGDLLQEKRHRVSRPRNSNWIDN